MINLDSYPIFRDNKDSLKNTSKDDGNPNDIQYMTNSEAKVVNFDMVKRSYANKLGIVITNTILNIML